MLHQSAYLGIWQCCKIKDLSRVSGSTPSEHILEDLVPAESPFTAANCGSVLIILRFGDSKLESPCMVSMFFSLAVVSTVVFTNETWKQNMINYRSFTEQKCSFVQFLWPNYGINI